MTRVRKLTESEVLLLDEALNELRRKKVEAFTYLAGSKEGQGIAFRAADFGIPQIDSLISLLGEAGVISATVPSAPLSPAAVAAARGCIATDAATAERHFETARALAAARGAA